MMPVSSKWRPESLAASTPLRRRGRTRIGSPMVWALFVLALCVFASWAVAAEGLSVHFLDVGQGDAALVEADGKWGLIDGGEREEGIHVVVPYLEQHGVRQLDWIVVTHPHADHIGGLLPVLEAVQVRRVFADGQVHTSKTYEQLLMAIGAKKIPFFLARQGRTFELGDATFEVLHLEEIKYDSLNDNGVVVLLRYRNASFLFAGDGEAGMEQDVSRVPFGPVDVLKVGHHGSDTSSSEDFLAKTAPSVAIISLAADNDYGHPSAVVMQRMIQRGIQILRTDQDGTIVVRTDGISALEVQTKKGARKIALGQGVPSTPQSAIAESDAKELNESAVVTDGLPLVNLNTATAAELVSLPGIGPALAARIITYRDEHTFQAVDDLVNVKGIGPKTLERIRGLVCVQ